MSLLSEIRRRNVVRAAAAYIVSAWLLIQVAETIFPLFGFDESPARLVVIILAIGFVPAMAISWVFELTPDGWRRESEIDRDSPASAASARRLDRTIMVVLAVGLAYFAIDKFVFSESREAIIVEQAKEEAFAEAQRIMDANKSLAVLPFQDLSPAQDQRFLADGIAGEILNILARLEGLNVTARSSSFQFRDTAQDLKAVGEALGVSYILEGSVDKSDDSLAVTAQLIDARTGFLVESIPFDSNVSEIFNIQEDIAREVAGALSIALDVDGRNELVGTRTDNVDAYLAFLDGEESVRMSVNWDHAIALYEQALTLDPDYVEAMVARGVMHGFISFTLPSDEARESQERGIEMVYSAIEIDPDFPRAYDVLSRFIWTRRDWKGATEMFAKYAQLAPADIPAQLGFENVLGRTGRISDAVRIGELQRRIDPVSFLGLQVHAERLIQVGRYDDAVQALADADRISPPPSQGTDIRRLFLALSIGEREGIRAALENYALADRRAKPVVDAVLANFDNEAAVILEVVREIFEYDESLTGEGRIIIASIAAFLGDPQFALEVFDKEFEVNVQRTNRLWYPFFSDMRKLPGFRALARRIGFVEYWKTYGWADTCRPIGEDEFECQ